MDVDVGIAIGITQQGYLQFGCKIVVERKTATIGYLVTSGVETYFPYQSRYGLAGMPCLGGPVAS